MLISFHSNNLQKICNKERDGVKALGADCARKLRQRMAELESAVVLSDISHLPPPRCHELTNRGGVFSVDLLHPLRLLLIPAHAEVPRKEDGGIDLAKVTEVEIIAIEDTHDPKNQRRG